MKTQSLVLALFIGLGGTVPVQAQSRVMIRIFKEESRLELWSQKDDRYVPLKSYPICRFSGQLGPKQRQGDAQAPEGFYEIQASSLDPHSAYHLSMNVGYPNALDRFWQRTGSAIMIHGDCVSIGCFAMGDAAIEEIYGTVKAALGAFSAESVAVQIFPFRPTVENLRRHAKNPWMPFWRSLLPAYEALESSGTLLRPRTEKGQYLFSSPRRASLSNSAWIAAYHKSYSPGGRGVITPLQCTRMLEFSKSLPHSVKRYVPTYQALRYPNGDVAADTGVCTDVVVRSLRKVGIDLQQELSQHRALAGELYPQLWGTSRIDRNIDHRRVPNLMVYLGSRLRRLPLSGTVRDHAPCDIVAWDLGGGVTHIGMVSDVMGPRGWPLVIHHLSGAVSHNDFLGSATPIGRYRLVEIGREVR